MLREVSFADDSGRFAVVAAVLGGLWWFYLRQEWQARVFGDAVARASEHPVQLHCQNCKLAHVNGNNNITGVDLGRGGVVWFWQFLGRGRNEMWLPSLVLRFLCAWNQNSSFFCAGKFWSAAPTSMPSRLHSSRGSTCSCSQVVVGSIATRRLTLLSLWRKKTSISG